MFYSLFFDLCQKNDYIKTRAIAKNIVFPIETEYGALDITINLSKIVALSSNRSVWSRALNIGKYDTNCVMSLLFRFFSKLQEHIFKASHLERAH